MLIRVNRDSVPFFEALASDVRVRILELLAAGDLNIKDLAEAVGISSPIMIRHVRKLEEAGLIKTRMKSTGGSVSRMCTLLGTEYRLEMPARAPLLRQCHETQIPVGHYTDIQAQPTCGLLCETAIIGHLDDPRYFMQPERMHAQMIWFTEGFVEYAIPNLLAPNQRIEELEISFEISSEAPDFNDDWPSDIRFSLDGRTLCEWTSPGDFGQRRGILTPGWWTSNQYGLLKMLRISHEGTLLDGEKVSAVTLDHVAQPGARRWVLRFEVLPSAGQAGGLTLFGRKFGNYSQDILVRTFFSKQA